MKADKYIIPENIKEAYDVLQANNKAMILGGGLFLRLQKRTLSHLIDCSSLISNQIKLGNEITIGAMTSLRTIEIHPNLPQGLTEAVRQIGGVGIRNMATIGGSICGRYPFSDINTALIAMDAQLDFYHHGSMSIRQFNEKGLETKDILLSIRLKPPVFSRSSYLKKVYTDFSVVNVCVADHTIAVGARPGRPVYMENVDYSRSASELLGNIEFGDDFKASGDYRRAVALAKLEDIMKQMGGHHVD